MKFKLSYNKIDYFALGIFVNDQVPIYDINKRTIVSFLLFKWAFHLTIIKNLLEK